jgi:hypothetical protein
MPKWLAALQTAENKSENAHKADPQNPQNPLGRGFEGFEDDPIGHFHNFSRVDDWAAFEERAAILEYDEGLTRADAEALAAEQIAYQRRGLLQ